MNLNYRTQDEIDTWRERDPLNVAVRALLEDGVSPAVIARVDDEVRNEVVRALAEARQGPKPRAESALRFMYASPIPTRWGTE